MRRGSGRTRGTRTTCEGAVNPEANGLQAEPKGGRRKGDEGSAEGGSWGPGNTVVRSRRSCSAESARRGQEYGRQAKRRGISTLWAPMKRQKLTNQRASAKKTHHGPSGQMESYRRPSQGTRTRLEALSDPRNQGNGMFARLHVILRGRVFREEKSDVTGEGGLPGRRAKRDPDF